MISRLALFLALFSVGFCAGQSADKPVASSPTAATPSLLADALALYRRHNFPAAIEKYQQLLQEKPSSPDAYAGLTRIYLKQGDVELAYTTATKGLALVDSPRLRVALGEVYFRQGKINDAEKEWVDVINSHYPDARAYLGLARVRDAISLYKQGKAMIDKAHELDPADPDIQSRWISTVRPAERIRYLENFLADAGNASDEDRADTQRYLDYLKLRAKEPRKRCHLANNVTSTETPLVRLLLDPRHLRGYGLTVNLNGHKANLMLDTGASGILVDRGTAQKAGITKLVETRIGGIGDKGSKSGYVGVADSIKIGELEFQDCPVEVLDRRSVVDEQGLIGADVFRDFLINLDFPKEKLRLSPLPKRPDDTTTSGAVALHSQEDDSSSPPADADSAPPAAAKAQPPPPDSSRFHDLYIAPEMKSYTRVYRFGHDLLVPTKVGNASMKFFLLDTGAIANQITPAAAREVTKVHGDSDTRVTGLSGSVNKVYSADKAILQFGHLKQENQDLVAFDLTSMSQNIGTEISGTLGFVLLHLLDIRIDYRDGLVDFDYKP